MASTSDRSAQTNRGFPVIPGFDFTRIIVGGEHCMEAIAAAHEHYFTRLASINRAIAKFVERRLEQERQTAHDLALCKSPEQLLTVWTTFIETASRQYAEQIGAVAGMSVDHAREAAEDTQHEIEAAMKPQDRG